MYPSPYSKNGICRFENFPECLNNTTEIELGHTETPYIAVNWFLGLERVSDPEGDRIRAYIKNVCEHETARITFQVLIKFLKSNNFGISLDGPWSRGNYTKGITDKVFSTHTMKISEIVNSFEWLDNGALIIKYGIHLEAYHKSDKIWNFNFHEKSFNWANVEFSKVIIKLGTIKGTELYCDKAAHIMRMNKPMKDVYEDEDVQLMSRNTMMLIMSKFMKDSF